MALMEICTRAFAGYIATCFFGINSLRANSEWVKFTAGAGAILLTFLAGNEPDPPLH